MAHWQQAPDPRLAKFIEALAFSSDEDEPDAPHAIRVVPDGCVDLLFSVAVEGGSGEAPRADVFGTKTRPLLIETGLPVENVAVRFRPGAAVRFLRTSASVLTDTSVDLSAFWGEGGRALVRDVAQAASPAERAAAIERALLERLAGAQESDALDRATEQAVACIERSGGRVSVRDLVAQVGVGERRLERAFRERVGVSPKRLARILRFRGAYVALARGRAQTEVALESGYSDQAHLLRDFRELAGAAPSRVLGQASDSSNRSD